ncbi:BREX-1 system adenine-specific DNA-methyltransferase PglX [Pseudoroseomonas sp. WGS1072]|uniref:SAM-dependent DNA methyltransferase n=1 Tax=Roseomonas sp. WGS1072 TaxID=3366816 RepID=UPI003BF3FFD9
MPFLNKTLRRQLATAIQEARLVAEEGAADAVRRLGVMDEVAPAYLREEDRELRRKLRAHARSLGDNWDGKVLTSVTRLVETTAFEHWHRMLFGRFLVERGLLVHPELGVAIAREELGELAAEEGLPDEWALVERIAAPALPAVFKPEDPVLAMTLAPEFSKQLRDIVVSLPTEVFTADDSLGWTYQFWRAAEKDAVNKSGVKIGSHELPAVTQLFTESYMVQFLLHNTLGAWWAGKVLAADPTLASYAEDEDTLRAACSLPGVEWDYLRFVREGEAQDGPWRPAAGTFPGWPMRAAEITFCDPCCGSGHFLTEGFAILVALRQREDGLSPADAVQAVLRDNLHGLELDGRCVQIAAFNVALVGWKLAGEPIALPAPHVAWIGAPPPMSRAEMAALGNGDLGLRRALEALHDQFAEAPILGSLLEIGARNLFDADLRERGEAAFVKLQRAEPERAEGAVAARGLFDAAAILGQRYVLLATNVPFLGRGRQRFELADFIARRMPKAKADLATAMLLRMQQMAAAGGAVASIAPQNWLYINAYAGFRENFLNETSFAVVAGLGSRAFETITGEVVNPALVIFSNAIPIKSTEFAAFDANGVSEYDEKKAVLSKWSYRKLKQADQKRNPQHAIRTSASSELPLLSLFADSWQGIVTSDNNRYMRKFWEVSPPSSGWEYCVTSPESTADYVSRDTMLWWRGGAGPLHAEGKAHNFPPKSALGRRGVLASQMGDMRVTLYDGEIFNDKSVPIIPFRDEHLPAIYCYLQDDSFSVNVREITRNLHIPNQYLLKVPFDLPKWEAVASERFPAGLPEPYSDDPTQWLFHGHPAFAETGTELHVGLAHIAGFRWPAQTDSSLRLSLLAKKRAALAASLPAADADGLLTIHANGTDRSLADRLRALLSAAYGASLTPAREAELVRAADAKLDRKEARDVSLEGWLRDRAFRQHCLLFQNRPFLWHVWDGLKDGFSALLHCHRLDHAAMEKLTYTLLGDWIARAKAEGNTARDERARQLQQNLVAIIEGEPPFDIFVRWKPLAAQPVGWMPDLDDGVRLNIRPFMTAGILREQPKGIAWGKDRGTDVKSAPWYHLGPKFGGKQGDRINDHHVTLAEKR